ncbi:hypothetical protein Q8814_18485, partial [Rhodococcus sp. CC-R104]|nr:hypothetical protein [Rhodococcus sp. CC-R104]
DEIRELTLGFLLGVRKRTDEESALTLARKQLTGIAGLASERIRNALGLPATLEGLATVLDIHPVFAPQQYVDRSISLEDGRIELRIGRRGGADADSAWPTLIDSDHLGPLDALVRGVDPHFTARVRSETADELIVDVVRTDTPAKEAGEVAITRFSTGADFEFADRGIPLPLIVL